jgi:hypothetical protein
MLVDMHGTFTSLNVMKESPWCNIIKVATKGEKANYEIPGLSRTVRTLG